MQTSDWVHDVRASAPLPLGAPHPPERASKWNDNALVTICKEGRQALGRLSVRKV